MQKIGLEQGTRHIAVTIPKGWENPRGDRTCASTSHHDISVVLPAMPYTPVGFFKQPFPSKGSSDSLKLYFPSLFPPTHTPQYETQANKLPLGQT